MTYNIWTELWLNWERLFTFFEAPLVCVRLKLLETHLFVFEKVSTDECLQVLPRILLFLCQSCWLHSFIQVFWRFILFSKLSWWNCWWVTLRTYFPHRNILGWLFIFTILFISIINYNSLSFLFIDLFFLVFVAKYSSKYIPLALADDRCDKRMVLLGCNKSSLRVPNNVIHFVMIQ